MRAHAFHRVAAGGQAMALPSADEVRLAAYDLLTALNPQTNAKDALINAQQAPDNLLPGPTGIEKLILDLYNDVENYYRDYPPGARRDLCRAWGLIYDEDAHEPIPPTPPTP